MSGFDAELPTLAEVESEVREARARKDREEVTTVARKILADREFMVQRRRADEQRRVAAEAEGQVVAAKIREEQIRWYGQAAEQIDLAAIYRVVELQVSADVAREESLYALCSSEEVEKALRRETLPRLGLTANGVQAPACRGSEVAKRVPATCLVGVDPGVDDLAHIVAVERGRRDERAEAQAASARREADHQRQVEERRRYGVELG
jgi:hypothetical protein